MQTNRRFLVFLIASSFVYLSSPSVVWAELGQGHYAAMQQFAPESVTVTVKRTEVIRTRDGGTSYCDVKAEVEIVSLERSKSKLRVGDCIKIEYSTVERSIPVAGPSPIPLLQVGQTHPAFLESTNTRCVYSPAARGWSFEKANADPIFSENSTKDLK